MILEHKIMKNNGLIPITSKIAKVLGISMDDLAK